MKKISNLVRKYVRAVKVMFMYVQLEECIKAPLYETIKLTVNRNKV